MADCGADWAFSIPLSYSGCYPFGVGIIEFLISSQPIRMIEEGQFKGFLKHFLQRPSGCF